MTLSSAPWSSKDLIAAS